MLAHRDVTFGEGRENVQERRLIGSEEGGALAVDAFLDNWMNSGLLPSPLCALSDISAPDETHEKAPF